MKLVCIRAVLICGWLWSASAAPGACPAPLPEAIHGAVSSESAICSNIGTQLIKDGGNAVDALVGTVFCVGTMATYHSGIGGGGFMLLRDKDGNYEFVDFRETAPAAAFEDMYQNNTDASLYGGLARCVIDSLLTLVESPVSFSSLASPAVGQMNTCVEASTRYGLATDQIGCLISGEARTEPREKKRKRKVYMSYSSRRLS